jgi:hypothetical protein
MALFCWSRGDSPHVAGSGDDGEAALWWPSRWRSVQEDGDGVSPGLAEV